MTRFPRSAVGLIILCFFFPSLSLAKWTRVAPGVEYDQFKADSAVSFHVARVDLRNERIKVVGSRPADRGETVTEFADKHDAVVAINGDYFDEKLVPIGVTIGPCGVWEERVKESKRKEALLAVGDGRAEIIEGASVPDPPPAWVRNGVSGWPMLITGCRALTAKELPGSDSFTRAPHPRTAVGLSSDKNTLYLVITEGGRNGTFGVTLAELAQFMRDKLEVCSGLNLDGGGSTTMALEEKLIHKLRDGKQRRVANHLGVVLTSGYRQCSVADRANGRAATAVAVSSESLWSDVAEVLGRKGVAERDQVQTFSFSRSEQPPLNGHTAHPELLSSHLSLRRSPAAVVARATLVATRLEEDDVREALKGSPLEVSGVHPYPLDIYRGFVLVHMAGTGEAVSLAHAFRKALEATEIRLQPDTAENGGDASVKALDLDVMKEALRGTGEGKVRLLDVRVPALPKSVPMLSDDSPSPAATDTLLIQPLGSDRVFVKGELTTRSSSLAAQRRLLRALGIAPDAQYAHPIEGQPLLSQLYFSGITTRGKVVDSIRKLLAAR